MNISLNLFNKSYKGSTAITPEILDNIMQILLTIRIMHRREAPVCYVWP
jgi:hypothetical protein